MSATPFTRRKFLISTAAAASSAWFLAACSGGEPDTPAAAPQAPSQIPQSEIDTALNTATTLTFWTWVPDIKNEVKLFTTKYPKIKVNVTNVGQGSPHYQKLRTTIQAGQGGPDVAQVEFQYINSFTLGEGDLLDLTPYAPATLKDSYPAWVWSQVYTNGGLWGIPQDTGPMGLLYREDLLQQAGLEAPKTYDDFASAAQTYRSKNPKSYLVNVAPNQAGQLIAYLWQAGVRPFSFDGQQTVKVDLASEQAKSVVKFWGDLVTSGTASSDPDFNDSWYQGLAGGKWATLPIAAWGPVFLQGTAGRTSGKWRAADLPQWDPAQSSPATGGAPPTPYSSSARIRCGLTARLVHQHRQGVGAQDGQRTVPLPGAERDSGGSQLPQPGDQVLRGPEGQREVRADLTNGHARLPMAAVHGLRVHELRRDPWKGVRRKDDAVAGLQAWQDGCAKYAKDQGFTVS